MSEATAQKSALRQQMRAQVSGMSSMEREAKATALVDSIRADARWRDARAVMLFIPLPDEINILPLVDQAMDHKKIVAIPRFNPATATYEAAQLGNLATDLVTGPFNVPEPRSSCAVLQLNRLDVTLVPGLAFDRAGWRLGRGKGYYDRLLANAGGSFWGVGFDWQLVETIPGEPHDVVLNCIVTPTHWLEVSPTRR